MDDLDSRQGLKLLELFNDALRIRMLIEKYFDRLPLALFPVEFLGPRKTGQAKQNGQTDKSAYLFHNTFPPLNSYSTKDPDSTPAKTPFSASFFPHPLYFFLLVTAPGPRAQHPLP